MSILHICVCDNEICIYLLHIYVSDNNLCITRNIYQVHQVLVLDDDVAPQVHLLQVLFRSKGLV
jgi:hypothetical protein